MSAVQRAVRAVEMTAMVAADNPLHELAAEAIHALRHIRAIATQEAVPVVDHPELSGNRRLSAWTTS